MTEEDKNIQVPDDEGSVDEKVKTEILNLRKQVNEDERQLYINLMTDPETNLSTPQANYYWGISVRQYLRSVKRLWDDEEVEESQDTALNNVKKYWQELVIGEETLYPPDTDGYQFSLMRHAERYDDKTLKREIGIPANADLPQPYTETFQGLSSVLNANRISRTWIVKTKVRGPPSEHETVTPQAVKPVPKHVLENAIEAADNFLQSVGIGLDISDEHQTEIDRELLEEVDEWRKQNVD